jgi:hypothetical protein
MDQFPPEVSPMPLPLHVLLKKLKKNREEKRSAIWHRLLKARTIGL